MVVPSAQRLSSPTQGQWAAEARLEPGVFWEIGV